MGSLVDLDIFISPKAAIGLLLCVSFFAFLCYRLFLSPLNRFPGPWQARVSNLWFARRMFTGDFHIRLNELHNQYGDIVRIGPNRLSFISPDAVKRIYLNGSTWIKSSYYDGFTAVIPNAFGTQDESFHRIRRKHLSYAFSQNHVLAMEPFMDNEMSKFRGWLERAATSGDTIDLRKLLHWLVIDVLGDLAFGKPFGVLDDGDDTKLPELEHHLRLGCTGGTVPKLLPYIRNYGSYLPIKWIHDAFACRNKLRAVAAEAVERAKKQDTQRKDILGALVSSINPETGKPLTTVELQAESFGFLIAGTHTTAVTLCLMCYYLLQNPACLQRLVEELDSNLAPIEDVTEVYQYSAIFDKLPYFAACLQETHRVGGVFNMPLYRIVPAEGAVIAGQAIPGGTEVSISNYCIHRNPAIWGKDVESFRPERWMIGTQAKELQTYNLPFSVGHRACLGRNLAITEIYKAVSTLFKHYEVKRTSDHELKMRSLGVLEVQDPLMVKISRR